MQLILHETERYPGVVVFCCVASEELDAVVHHVHPALLRAMKQVVQFRLPDAKLRERLWRALVPPACPLEAFDPKALASESEGFAIETIERCLWKAGGRAVMTTSDVLGGGGGGGGNGGNGGSGQKDNDGPPPQGIKARDRPVLKQAEILRAVRDERDKLEGRASRLVQSMMM